MLNGWIITALSIGVSCCGVLSDDDKAKKNDSTPAAKIDAKTAKAAFDRFAKLEGSWKGKSTKGWTDTNSYRVIAKGSVVMGTSFDAHPGETMITMIHMDSERLMLTHYCVAKNQPRMVATSVEGDGTRIKFEFLDGTNMSSRDKGHMDSVVYRFVSEGEFTSHWTWYQDGKESWMEEISYERVKE